MTHHQPRPRWWLRVALLLYPAEHRRTYGAEILEALTEERIYRRGRTPAWIADIWSISAGAPGVWYDRIRQPPRRELARGLGLDLRFLARSLRHSWGYALTATIVLACAVAANAAVFSYVRGTLLARPAYDAPEEIAIVWGSSPERGQLRDVVSGPTFVDAQERLTTLSAVAALHSDGAYLVVDGRPVVLEAHEVSVDFFDIFGVQPLLGRLFDDRERFSGGAETVVVTHGFWESRLGSNPEAIGSALSFEGGPRTVIGVLPEGFEFLSPAPLFVPLAEDNLAARSRSSPHFHVLGRLAPGATFDDVNVELETVMAELFAEFPEYEGWSLVAEPFHEVTVEAVRPAILILTGTVLLVLLVALVNLANLFRIRAFSRKAELSVRSAIGGGRLQIARLLALETLVIASSGAVLGLFATPYLLATIGGLLPTWVAIPDSAARVPVLLAELDWSVVAAAFSLSVVGSLVLTASSLRSETLRAGLAEDRTVHAGMRGSRGLVGVEIAVAALLCVGAGLAIQSTGSLMRTDLGVEGEGVLTMYFGDVWGADPEERVAYFRAVTQEVERLPGVVRAGVMGYVDFQAEDDFAGISFLDRTLQPSRNAREEWRRVDEGLIEAAGMYPVRGRVFAPDDFRGPARVALVNQSFATKHFGGDAVDELISVHNPAYRELRIVGVLADVRTTGPAVAAPPTLYVPYQGDPRGTQGLYVRVDGEPMAFANDVQEAIWSVDPSQPIDTVSPLSQWIDMWIAVPKATRALVSALAILAWLLSAFGVFGVVAYSVRARRAEFGIRLALGASPRRLQRDHVLSMAPVVAIGLAVGVGLGVLAARLSQAVLFGVSPADPTAIGVSVFAVGGAAILASLAPTWNAVRQNPTQVIRPD